MRTRLHPRLLAVLAFGAASTLSLTAHAECSDDSDCDDGFVCEVVGAVECTDELPPPCPPGEDCPDPCEREEVTACVPDLVECATDADCAEGLTCVSFTYDDCDDIAIGTDEPGDREEPGDGSDPQQDGPGDTPDVPEEGGCEEVTEAFCAPAWVGACEVDADCGDGFACVEAEVCECSGSGSSGGGSAGGGDVPPEPGVPTPDPDEGGGSDAGFGDDDDEDGGFEDDEDGGFDEDVDCSCFGTGEFYCEPQEVACANDADCPSEWTCETFSASVACTFDAETGEEICEEGESESFCAPPSWDVWGGAVGGGSYDGALDPGSSDDGRDGEVNEEGQGGDSTAGGLDDEDGSRAPTDEGCAAAGGAPSAGWLLPVLGLLGLRRRRRA